MAGSILFTIGSRANWGSSCAVIREWKRRGLPFRVLCYASAIDRMYGDVAVDIEAEFGEAVTRGSGLVPGNNSAALTSALALMQDLGDEDIVYVVGDRYEVLAIAYSALLAGKTMVHQMGGERSGNVDDYVREAVSALADVHFVATESAQFSLRGWVRNPRYVHLTGCPRIDTALQAEPHPESIVMVMLHPADLETDYTAVLEAAARVGETHVWWPNADPGNEYIVETIRELGIRNTHRNMPPELFYSYLRSARLIVGNSSVIVRETSALGVPGVLIGWRQVGRPLLGAYHCSPDATADELVRVFREASSTKREASTEYGDGKAALRICDALEQL
jgi:UDP-hydrolysing UDP-N-acetyl-D-glucosamine 2-epimerase